MRTKEKENGSETETRTRSYAIAGIVAIAFALVAAMMVITPAAATTVTFSPDRDNFLSEMDLDCNFGGSSFTGVMSFEDGNERIIVHFDLSSIPSGASINSAKLYLYRYAYEEYYIEGEDRTYNIHRMVTDWTEYGSTWVTTDGTTNWGTQGGDYVSTPTDSIPIDYDLVGIWNEWDITSDTVAFVEGTEPNYGWLIKDAVEDIYPEDSGPESRYRSREYTDESLRPYLEVTYTEAGCLGDCYTGADCTGDNLGTDMTCSACLAAGGISWNITADKCSGDLYCPDTCIDISATCPVCSNGADDDTDGLIDCADPGCACCCDYTETDDEGVPCVPELASVFLLGTGLIILVGYVGLIRRRRA